uniref:E3 ubiquitin-protein ligase CHFR n=1 Tax=Daphnia magna TaxID=35525 RepID=A0A0P5L0Q4_9CRUS
MASSFPVALLRRIGTNETDYKCIQLDCNEVTIGRSKENFYTIADLLVSRKHAVFRLNKDQWAVESVGMNGIAVNHIIVPKHQQIPIQHMDTIEFGAGSKFVYAFRLQSADVVNEEPLTKKMRLPLANRNYPSLKDSPEAFHNWVRSKKNLEKTLEEESDNLDAKLELQKSLKDKLVLEQEKLNEHFEKTKAVLESKFSEEKKELEEKVARGEMEKNELQRQKEDVEKRMLISLQEFQVECAKKKIEFEESVARANREKEMLIEQKELVVQQLLREKSVLQERLEEESRLKEETMNELAQVKRSHQSLEQELNEARRKIEEETKQHQQKGSEDELRLRQMQEELAEREARLNAKEREIVEIQSRAAIGLEMYETIQLLQQGQEIENTGNIVVVMDDGQASNLPSLTEQELEKVREELRIQKELNEIQQRASSKACVDIVGQMESIMENELQCGICSELMVFATSLNCMHTFCQYCVQQWKKNKVECPICRAPITTEGRNLLVDNMIDAMVKTLSEETKNRRKELVRERQEQIKMLKEIKIFEQISIIQNVTFGTIQVDGTRIVDQPNNSRGQGRIRRAAGRIVSNAPPSTARATVAAVPHTVTLPQAVRPRVAVAVARQAGRPLVQGGPSAGPVRGTLNRSTAPAPTFPNPRLPGPSMYVARNARPSQVGPRH